MEIVRSDPVRVRICMDQIRRIDLCGTTATFERVDPSANPNLTDYDKVEWYATIRTNDTNPYSPKMESVKEAIDKVLENLDVRQDHIREQEPHRIFDESKNPYKYWLEVDEKLFQKETRYDKLLDNIKESHKMPYKNGKVLARFV